MSQAINSSTEKLNAQLYALAEVAKTLTSPLSLPDLLNAIVNKLVGVLEPAEVGAVMLWDQSAGLFRAEAAFGYDLEILREMGLRAGESITGKVYDEGKARLLSTPEQVTEAMADMRLANQMVMARAAGIDRLPCCTLAIPITANHHKYGVLVLETIDGPALFSSQDVPFVQSLADLIALAIERCRLEDQADAVREAQRIDRMRSEVMATLSHELRMPLTVIQGYASALLLDEVTWSDDKREEFLRLIEDECNDMQIMIRDILDTSLIEVDQLALNCQPVRLEKIARDIAEEIHQRTELHRILIDFPSDFPIVAVDPHWIKQVFRNLLDNAVKYSPEGSLIMIKGSVRAKDVMISIADQGIGISPEDLIPLFEKYFRVKSAATLHVAGTGLGLPIARAIVEAHSGRIWAESKLGEGTTLHFSLPHTRPIAGEKD